MKNGLKMLAMWKITSDLSKTVDISKPMQGWTRALTSPEDYNELPQFNSHIEMEYERSLKFIFQHEERCY